jgi:hypothetical protein
MLHRLLYVSRVAAPLTAAEVRLIVGQAQMFNRRRDLTGLLGFTGSHFLQVLEGEEAQLDDVMRSIARDRRHEGLRMLRHEAVQERRFGRWSMSLVDSLDASDDIGALVTGEVSTDHALAVLDRLLEMAE